MPELRRLQYFVAVARERNFTRAAERLHIAQPALSRQVQGLERELGVELLHRTTHEFELTPAGELLLARGPALLGAAEELWRDVRSHGLGETGSAILAYGVSASDETAPRFVAGSRRASRGSRSRPRSRRSRRSSPASPTGRSISGSFASRRSIGSCRR